MTMAVAASAATASEPDQRSFRFDVDASRFSGDYGSTEPITYDALTTHLRWRARRTELRLSLPYVRLDGGASLVGGAPLPGSAGGPGAPPAGPGSPDPPAPVPRAAPLATEGASGPGDVDLRLDFDLVAGRAKRPWVTALARVKLPTADEQKGLGTGETDFEGGLLLFQPIGRYGLMLEGRYTRMGDPPGLDYDDVVRAVAGVSRSIGPSARGLVYLYAEQRSHPIQGYEARSDVMLGGSSLFGARRRVRLSGGVYVGLSETAEDWGSQLTLGRVF